MGILKIGKKEFEENYVQIDRPNRGRNASHHMVEKLFCVQRIALCCCSYFIIIAAAAYSVSGQVPYRGRTCRIQRRRRGAAGGRFFRVQKEVISR